MVVDVVGVAVVGARRVEESGGVDELALFERWRRQSGSGPCLTSPNPASDQSGWPSDLAEPRIVTATNPSISRLPSRPGAHLCSSDTREDFTASVRMFPLYVYSK